MRISAWAAVFLLIIGLGAASSRATTVWNEGTQGDISSAFATPTDVGSLAVGTWSVIATSGGGDREFVHMNIASGRALSSIVPSSYIPGDGTSFIGVGSGTTGPDPSLAPGNLLGYTHFGTGPGNVGTNIEPSMSTGSGAIGFTPPLGPGDYTFWMQQLGAATTFQMDFVVTPEPASLGLLGLAGLGLLRWRRRNA